MEKVFVVQRVATQLFAAENSVDAAMSEASTLMSEMLKARKELGLSATVADGAFAKVADAIKALGQHFGLSLERSRCYPYAQA